MSETTIDFRENAHQFGRRTQGVMKAIGSAAASVLGVAIVSLGIMSLIPGTAAWLAIAAAAVITAGAVGYIALGEKTDIYRDLPAVPVRVETAEDYLKTMYAVLQREHAAHKRLG